MRRLPALLLVLAIAAAPLAASEVYSWKDANGVTHYSQTPPPAGTRFELRTVRNDGSARPSATAAAATATETARPAGTASDASGQCDLARRNIEALQGEGPVHQEAADGETRELDAAERTSQLELAQAAVRAYCR